MTSTITQKILLILSIVFIVLGLALTLGGAFSPAWQVVDIREFRAEHQHGLWWDCVRAEKHVVAVGDFYDETPLHCMQKFDNSAEMVIENTLNNIDQDGAAGESEHHRFWYWHKIVLFFIIFGAFCGFISICTGVCAPCYPQCAFVFSISLFIAMICSLIADGVFFLAANRVDNRFVQGMVGTYEQRIGYAFYIHLLGTIAWMFAFICTLATTYKFFSKDSAKELVNGFKTFGVSSGAVVDTRPAYNHTPFTTSKPENAFSYPAQPRSGNAAQLNNSFSYNPGPINTPSFGSRVRQQEYFVQPPQYNQIESRNRQIINTNDAKFGSYDNRVQYSQPVRSYQPSFGSQSHHFRETSA